MKKYILAFIMTFIISMTISFGGSMLLSPKIKIPQKRITISVGESYKEPKVKAYMLGNDVSKEVKKRGKVNTNKTGKYKIDYQINKYIFLDKERIIVNVVDNEPPKIELTGGKEVKVCPTKEYVELGYTVTDNYDKDLTDKVKIIKNENEITYEVTDTSNNKAKETRTIKKIDDEKPTITLKGDSYITVYLGNTYNEPGYTANDNCDGDITNKVEVSGQPNTSVIGTYNIVYKVKDSNNNENSITRTVKVEQRTIIRPQGGGNGKGIVYLTFDDGPNEGTTNTILNVLKEEGVQATFFVTCNGPDYLIQRMHNEGHTVALHTASHNYNYVYASETNYFNDLDRVSSRVERLTGIKSIIIRFPGGSSNTVSRFNPGIMTRLTSEVKKRGYHYFDWNVDSNDAAGASANGVYSNVINNISLNRENVVLMHDIKSTTASAIRNIITYGKSNGFTFRKITNDTAMVTHGVNN